MNERIQELVGQAKFMAEETINKQISKNEELDAFAEKFAELIVRECCQYLNSEAERLYALSASEHRPNFKEDFEICAEKCYDNIQGIKEHFGVGE
jgi:hypothetical protein